MISMEKEYWLFWGKM